MINVLINYTTPANGDKSKRNNMNLFRNLIDFLEGNFESLRFDVVSNRVNNDLRYLTVADSKREMRNDFIRVRRDFDRTIKSSKYGKES